MTPVGFIYAETVTLCHSVEMYQISVCRAQSKIRFVFWVSLQNGCKDTIFFRIYQIPEHYFCVFCYFFCKDTTNRANNQIMSFKNYTSVSKQLNLIRKCDKRQELFVCLQKKMYFCTEFTKARLRRYEYEKRYIARTDGTKFLCLQFYTRCFGIRHQRQNGL